MLKRALRPIFHWGPTTCPACGKRARLRHRPVMWRELGEEWGLTDALYRQFDRREGTACVRCSSNLRSRQLAEVLTREMGKHAGVQHDSLKAMCSDLQAQRLDVAEINSLGALHQFLKLLPGLRYSEYLSDNPEVPSEDLMALSYADESFDFVATSEVIEHIPDMEKALSEIRRILRPGGAHIFTIPVLWDRQTRTRAELVSGDILEHLPSSYHGAPKAGRRDYLVFHEFGNDVVDLIEKSGFSVETIRDGINETMNVFVARRD